MVIQALGSRKVKIVLEKVFITNSNIYEKGGVFEYGLSKIYLRYS